MSPTCSTLLWEAANEVQVQVNVYSSNKVSKSVKDDFRLRLSWVLPLPHVTLRCLHEAAVQQHSSVSWTEGLPGLQSEQEVHPPRPCHCPVDVPLGKIAQTLAACNSSAAVSAWAATDGVQCLLLISSYSVFMWSELGEDNGQLSAADYDPALQTKKKNDFRKTRRLIMWVNMECCSRGVKLWHMTLDCTLMTAEDH